VDETSKQFVVLGTLAENAPITKASITLRRQVKRSGCTKTNRICLVLLARSVQTWRQAPFIVQPETLLRWHQEGFRLLWQRKSKVPVETIALIKDMGRTIGSEDLSGAFVAHVFTNNIMQGSAGVQ
jgi:putative transposase